MKEMKVYKANDLVNARYRLDAVELKVVLWLVSRVKPDDADFALHRLHYAEIGIDKKSLKALARSLVSKTFEVKTSRGWIVLSWLSSVEYIDGQGTIELCFDPKLKPYLLDLKEQFTAYRLSHVLPMRSSYAIRIYELLLQYEKIKHRTFSLDELRSLLRIPASYRVQDIRRRVLEPAIRDINAHTDLEVSYRLAKEGRAYKRVEFEFSKKRRKTESLKEFIERIRQTRVNQELMRAKDEKTGAEIALAVSDEGLLYNMLDPDWHITKKRALKIWREMKRRGV